MKKLWEGMAEEFDRIWNELARAWVGGLDSAGLWREHHHRWQQLYPDWDYIVFQSSIETPNVTDDMIVNFFNQGKKRDYIVYLTSGEEVKYELLKELSNED